MLEAVEKWADGYMMLRETGIAVNGRVDALLVPIGRAAHCMKRLSGPFWKRPRLVGVEIKTNRGDFIRGSKNQQYERYAETLGGLYVATLRGVCQTSELPAGVGHLVVYMAPTRCWKTVCRRHPEYREVAMAPDTPWRILFEVIYANERVEDENDRRQDRIDEKLGDIVASHVMPPLKQIRDRLQEIAVSVPVEQTADLNK